MAAKKKRKIPTASTSAIAKMDIDPSPPSHAVAKSILSANTNAGISKSKSDTTRTKQARLPRGKNLRAQRARKEKGAEKAEVRKERLEGKVERSRKRGRRRGERNAKWEDLNEKIKGAVREGRAVETGQVEGEGGDLGEEMWVDEDDAQRVDGGLREAEGTIEAEGKLGGGIVMANDGHIDAVEDVGEFAREWFNYDSSSKSCKQGMNHNEKKCVLPQRELRKGVISKITPVTSPKISQYSSSPRCAMQDLEHRFRLLDLGSSNKINFLYSTHSLCKMPPTRMTANPVKPARYRPGKPVAEEHSSEDEYETEEEEQDQNHQPDQPSAPPPKASSFPADAAKIANNLRNVDLNQRRRQAAAEEAARLEAERLIREKEEEGFETEESEDEESSEGSEASESGSEESSSEDEAPKKLLRPTFIKKNQRRDDSAVAAKKTEDELWAEQEAQRKAKANEMIQEQLERDAATKAAGKKEWDDDEDVDADEVDDTDDIDPETERAAWKLRELKRVKRDREAIEEAEKEREEIERRRNLTQEEREAEDKVFLEQQKEEREGKGKMGYMQKYFHKGAFFQDDAKAKGLDRRDIMGSRYQDDVVNRELLPLYMQIRDMTKLGRKGRTKYKDLKNEDTGRWGQYDNRGPRRDNTLDERFQPDRDGGGQGPSGANNTAVGVRRKAPEDAPTGPKAKAIPAEKEIEVLLKKDGGGAHRDVPTRDQDHHHLVEIDIANDRGGLTQAQDLLHLAESHTEIAGGGPTADQVHVHGIEIDPEKTAADENGLWE
ncbi:MAG: hypothetical protein Q9194_003404 [Teloschistes cf. exilis]